LLVLQPLARTGQWIFLSKTFARSITQKGVSGGACSDPTHGQIASGFNALLTNADRGAVAATVSSPKDRTRRHGRCGP
jgi:hypothetical protein